MTLPEPTELYDSPADHQLEHPSGKDELTHVSEVLAKSGIPVADSLKERMLDKLAALIEDENSYEHEREPRRSA